MGRVEGGLYERKVGERKDDGEEREGMDQDETRGLREGLCGAKSRLEVCRRKEKGRREWVKGKNKTEKRGIYGEKRYGGWRGL